MNLSTVVDLIHHFFIDGLSTVEKMRESPHPEPANETIRLKVHYTDLLNKNTVIYVDIKTNNTVQHMIDIIATANSYDNSQIELYYSNKATKYVATKLSRDMKISEIKNTYDIFMVRIPTQPSINFSIELTVNFMESWNGKPSTKVSMNMTHSIADLIKYFAEERSCDTSQISLFYYDNKNENNNENKLPDNMMIIELKKNDKLFMVITPPQPSFTLSAFNWWPGLRSSDISSACLDNQQVSFAENETNYTMMLISEAIERVRGNQIIELIITSENFTSINLNLHKEKNPSPNYNKQYVVLDDDAIIFKSFQNAKNSARVKIDINFYNDEVTWFINDKVIHTDKILSNSDEYYLIIALPKYTGTETYKRYSSVEIVNSSLN